MESFQSAVVSVILGGDVTAIAAAGTGVVQVGPTLKGDMLDALSVAVSNDAAVDDTAVRHVLEVYANNQPTTDPAQARRGSRVLGPVTVPATPSLVDATAGTVVNVLRDSYPIIFAPRLSERYLTILITNGAAAAPLTGSLFVKVFRPSPRG